MKNTRACPEKLSPPLREHWQTHCLSLKRGFAAVLLRQKKKVYSKETFDLPRRLPIITKNLFFLPQKVRGKTTLCNRDGTEGAQITRPPRPSESCALSLFTPGCSCRDAAPTCFFLNFKRCSITTAVRLSLRDGVTTRVLRMRIPIMAPGDLDQASRKFVRFRV